LLNSSIPTSFLAILESFRGCFTRPSFGNFIALVRGWVLCQGRHSISRVVQATGLCPGESDHSVFYRFFSRARWSPDALGYALFQLLLPFLGQVIVAMLDDTLAGKSGPHIFGAGMHHDALASNYGRGMAKKRVVSFAFGHNWVVLALFVPLPWNKDKGFAIPVLFRLYRSKKLCPKEVYRKRTELARDLLSLLLGWIPEDRRLVLTGDREYSCRTLVRDLPGTVEFVGPVPMNAALYEEPRRHKGRGRPRKKGERLPSPKEMALRDARHWKEIELLLYGKQVTILVQTLTCLWYTVAGGRLVRIVVTRDPRGRLADRVFFSTDPSRSVQEILVLFSRRWGLEVTFRAAKQSLGIEDPQNGWWRREKNSPRSRKRAGPNPHPTRGKKAAERTAPFAFFIYGLVIVWYLRNGDRTKDIAAARAAAPWYRRKNTISFEDMLVALRRECWRLRFSANPLFERVPRNLRDLLPGWLLAA